MTTVETILLTSGASIVATLIGKLTWDKWNRGDSGGVGRKCADHENCIVRIAELQQAQENNEKQFLKGEKRMDEMAKNIGEIKTGVALLVQRADLHDAKEKGCNHD